MKNVLFTMLLLAGFTIALQAQQKVRVKDKDLPSAIQSNFKTEFPDARDAEWIQKDGHYKVEFEVNDVDNIAAFDADGKLISKGIEIKQADIPAAITSAVQAGYAGKAIDEVYKVEKDGKAHYLVELKGDPDTKILYSADGQLIKEK